MAESRNALGRLILVTIGMPSLIVAWGLWQGSRAAADEARLERQRVELARAVDWLDAGGAVDRLEFRHDGRFYAGPLAAATVRDTLSGLDRGRLYGRVRRALARLVVADGAGAVLLAALVLAGAALLERVGLRSRDRLVGGFSLLRLAMPTVLGALVLLLPPSPSPPPPPPPPRKCWRYPDLLTTDLGLGRLWDRTFTLLAGLMLFATLPVLWVLARLRRQQAARARMTH